MTTPTTTSPSSYSSPPSSSATPSHIFIIRHGARLDAADRDWWRSSPTAYDTPLTYGGWIQSRHLGTRIASLLSDAAAVKEPGTNTKKRMRIVIHSSPFLRCIQTSVSIASGLSQHHHQQAADANCELGVAAERFIKPVMRLDAWLGEWLLQGYYTNSTQPPPSRLMVSTARDEYLRVPIGIGIPMGSSPMPPPHHHHHQQHDEATLSTSLTGGFDPLSPNYAASSSGPIPMGYVSQAKELVDFDCPWDSLQLGEGAELGEGRKSMFMRFKNGYEQLLRWYDAPKPSVTTAFTTSLTVRSSTATTTTTTTPTPPLSEPDPEDDGQEIETVVILVTHGGGCTALLNVIADEPVVVDVGICSVSWGVLRPSRPPPPSSSSSSSPPQPSSFSASSSSSSNDLPSYNLILTANTDHMCPLTPSGAISPRSPYLSARPPRNSSGRGGGFVLSSNGAVGGGAGSRDHFLGSLKTTRSVKHGQDDSARPTGGIWTIPWPHNGHTAHERSKRWDEVDDVVAAAADAMAALATKILEDDKYKEKAKEEDKDEETDEVKDKVKDDGGLAVSAAAPVELRTAQA